MAVEMPQRLGLLCQRRAGLSCSHNRTTGMMNTAILGEVGHEALALVLSFGSL